MRTLGIMMMSAVLLSIALPSPASALAEFRRAFQEKYTNKNIDPAFYDLVKDAKCFVCHVKGEDKDVRNAYGNALADLVPGEANKRKKAAPADEKSEVKAKILEELQAAWDEAAEKENEDGVKFGDLIKAGKLPVPVPKKSE